MILLRQGGPVSPWLSRPKAAGEIIGWRRDGRPIYVAGGGAGPALVQSKDAAGTSVSSLTITLSNPTGAGNCLIAGVTNAQIAATPATVSGVTLGGAADNFAAGQTATGTTSEPLTAVWVDPGCAGGQTSVVITLSKSITTVVAWVMEWSGVATASPLDGAGNEGTGASASWSSGSTGTLGTAGDLVVGVIGEGASAAQTITGPSSPWTNLAQVDDSSSRMGLMASYQVVSGTTAQTYSGTMGSTDGWAAVVIALKALGGRQGALLTIFP